MTLRWRLTHPVRLIDALKERAGSSFSARFFKRALESNVCRVNGKVERFASALLQKGDQIELQKGWELIDEKKSISTILFEDDQLLVIDKPAGALSTDDYFQKVLKKRVWLSHRLDKETTGVLLFGKDPLIARELQECFEKRCVQKEYLALVDRSVKDERGVLKSHFVKKGAFQGQTIWGSSGLREGLYAETEWIRLESQNNASLLMCRPHTGRTHQIRVHLAEMGHPILIDRQYAKVFHSKIFAARPLLHAKSLSFTWKNRSYQFSALLPRDFADTLREFGFSFHG